MADTFATFANSSAAQPWMTSAGSQFAGDWSDFTTKKNLPTPADVQSTALSPWQALLADPTFGAIKQGTLDQTKSVTDPFFKLAANQASQQRAQQLANAGYGIGGGTEAQLTVDDAVRIAGQQLGMTQDATKAQVTAALTAAQQAGGAGATTFEQMIHDFNTQASQQAAIEGQSSLATQKAQQAPSSSLSAASGSTAGGGRTGFGNIAAATGAAGTGGFGKSSYADTPPNQSTDSDKWNAAQAKAPWNDPNLDTGNYGGSVNPDVNRGNYNTPSGFDQLAMSPEGTPGSETSTYPNEEKPTWQAAPGSYYFASSMAK